MKLMYVFAFFIICLLPKINAQKIQVDTAAFDKWPYVHSPGISNDGKYVYFSIGDFPLNNTTFVVKAADGLWKKEIIGAASPKFTCDNKKLFVIVKGTLLQIELGTTKVETIPDVESFKLISNRWLLYNRPSFKNRILISDTKSGHKEIIDGVLNYYISPNGKTILLRCTSKNKNAKQELEIYDLMSHRLLNIWEGVSADHIIFDKTGNQVVFFSMKEGDSPSLELYCNSTKRSETLISPNFEGSDSLSLNPSGPFYKFSNDGKHVFFALTPKSPKETPNKHFGVTVWNYKDPKLQSLQSYSSTIGVQLTAVVSIESHKLTLITKNFERPYGNVKFNTDLNNNYILVEKIEGDPDEWFWNSAAMQQVILISTLTGKRTILSTPSKYYLKEIELSPGGNYVVYFDSRDANYYCYEIKTGRKRNLTSNVKTKWNTYFTDESMNIPVGIAGWLPNDESLLINDQTDIWKIDPTNTKLPEKITTSPNNSQIFTLAFTPENRIIKTDGNILLQSFNIVSKNCGFYTLDLGNLPKKIKLLSSGPFNYHLKFSSYSVISQTDIATAKSANAFLIIRQTASHSPNFFYTRDFKEFKDMSEVYPEKKYTWISSELHTFTLSNGGKVQGILYKPDNFDSSKRYPVILYYYDNTNSEDLNRFRYPDASGDIINFPWYTTNGYLIFRPDIVYDPLKTAAESALESVTSAARYLKTKPWVNGNKMGIQGHSAGGFETNYIITHTDMFAAAMEGAGMSNLISMYGSIWDIGSSQQLMYEVGIYRMRGDLWEKQQSYLNNSPILFADKVKTPLLMMHNKLDGSVPYTESLSFFIALRRLQKKVWFLQYDNENHSLMNKYGKMDFTIRVKQFFDHYLMGKPAPVWMTKGVPAKLKGIETGLELDTSGTEP